MDCTWRGEPLYSARFLLSTFEADLFYDYEVYDRIASQQASNLASSSCADAFAREVFPDGATFFSDDAAWRNVDRSCFAELSASVYVVRSDGGVACIGAGCKTTGEILSVDFGLDFDLFPSSLHNGYDVDAEDCIGPFVDFNFKDRLMKYNSLYTY